jgi:hypothetical protein
MPGRSNEWFASKVVGVFSKGKGAKAESCSHFSLRSLMISVHWPTGDWSSYRWMVLLVLLCAAALPARSQGFPPAALGTATSVEAAFMALGAGKPEPSTRLLLDLPDITIPGRVHAKLASELPGTAAFVLLRGAPLPPPQPNAPPPAAAPPVNGQPAAPVLIKAYKFPAGQESVLELDFDAPATQSYTLLAYAQGRWFMTTRDIKVGSAPKLKSATLSKRIGEGAIPKRLSTAH